MNIGTLKSFTCLLAITFIHAGCAKISSPSGGLRDKLPPVVVESDPENGAKNFKDKKFVVTFNEYVVLDNINEKFMVSPPMQKKPRVFIRGKNVFVEYDDTLKDSTTYTFYFLDAIKDLNEGNVYQNYQFVFSTGPVIDSLSVTGNVYNSTDLEIPEKTYVLLYRDEADSAVIKELPDYLSRVDKTGYFRIDNIKGGKYRLYALKDDDNSKNYNRREELFGFLDSLVFVRSPQNYISLEVDTAKIAVEKSPKKVPELPGLPKKVPELPVLKGEYKVILFEAQKKDHYLAKSSRDLKYLLVYILSLPPDTMKVEFSIADADEKQYFTESSRNRDTLNVWITDSTLYSQPQISSIIKYPFTDTLGVLGYKQDTIPMRFLAPRAPRAAKISKPKLTVENNITGGAIKPGQVIVFRSQTPLKEPDTTRIRLYELIEKNKQRLTYRLFKDSINSGKLILDAGMQEGKQYLLITDSASFTNLYNESIDSAGIKFSVRNADSYNTMKLDIQNCNVNCIIQLLTNTEKLISEAKISRDGIVEFKLLEKGIYRVRIIYDLNGDGKWTTGDFMNNIQPEPVSYYPTELEIKEGWDITQTWDIKIKNYKEQKLRQSPKK